MSSPFITGESLGTTRNDAIASAGFRFTVGGSNLTAISLGRWVIAGNSQSHTLTIWDVSAAAVIATVVVNTSGAPTGQFLYGSITPVTLVAGQSYNIESSEAGGDDWYQDNTGVTPDAAFGTMVGSVYLRTNVNSGGNFTYVLTNVLFGLPDAIGDLGVALGSVGLTAAGAVGIAGDLSKTLGGVSESGAGTNPITGVLTKTLGDVGISAAGSIPENGSLALSLGGVGVSAAGAVAVAGNLAKVLGDVGLGGAGTSPITGAFSKTLGGVILGSAGQVFDPAVVGNGSITLGDVFLSAAGTKRFPKPPNNLVQGRTRSDFWQTHDFPEIL